MNWLNNMFSSTPSAPIEANALLIDVRSPEEFASGYVEGAINVPLPILPLRFQEIAPDTARQVVVYCRSGARSGMAQQFLKERNYANVVNGGSVDSTATIVKRTIIR
jgi:phage shock protein E